MTTAPRTPDYKITMVDQAGRTAILYINGASIDEKVAAGYSFDEALEGEESNQFEKAISQGRVGADAWVESSTRMSQEQHEANEDWEAENHVNCRYS